jgi:hypothetical protein
VSDVGNAIRKALGVKPAQSPSVSTNPAAPKFTSRVVRGDLYLAVEGCPVVTVYRAGARRPQQINVGKQIGSSRDTPGVAARKGQLMMPWRNANLYAYHRVF